MARVVILKAESDNSEAYAGLLQKQGLEPIFVPTLDFSFKNLEVLRDQLLSPYKYSGLIFTSPRSITAVRDALKGQKLKDDWKTLANYCVGETSYDLILRSLDLDTKGQHSGNASNLADFMKTDLYNKTVTMPFLFPCGNLKQDVLQNKLSEYGYSLDSVEVYETVPHRDLERHLLELFGDGSPPEYLLFFSPSGINYCASIFERHKLKLGSCRIVAIGPSTKKAIENKGYPVYRTAEKPTPEFVVSALLET
ncbi:uroporphyrinogen-III synthase-like [Uranotaenia lowii]|uniref:uroporphyrinogen-III synthase-like n=1 Tax=Uranotaenia lowii TaxID=190385 RepID=UPI00247A3145|nr:uroporphyrinogen-III synthase-like [Uranotaenia lowii]XP_055596423.1 uroporphyrinogen-III synthase-like [Uranotaenia lowii]